MRVPFRPNRFIRFNRNKLLFIFFKLQVPLKNLENLPRPFLGLALSIFVEFFEI